MATPPPPAPAAITTVPRDVALCGGPSITVTLDRDGLGELLMLGATGETILMALGVGDSDGVCDDVADELAPRESDRDDEAVLLPDLVGDCDLETDAVRDMDTDSVGVLDSDRDPVDDLLTDLVGDAVRVGVRLGVRDFDAVKERVEDGGTTGVREAEGDGDLVSMYSMMTEPTLR